MPIPKKVLAYRKGKRLGFFMKPKTFKEISEGSGGGLKGSRIAGSVYWRAVLHKFKKRRSRNDTP